MDSNIQSLYFKYIRGLTRIYDNYKLTPNQHFSLHLSKVLRRFGPPHAYWAFPFEQYIGLICHIHTNQRLSTCSNALFMITDSCPLGKMEATFMVTYCMGSNLCSNLCSLLSSNKILSALATLLPFIKLVIDPDTRGSLMSDLAVFRAQAEPAIVFNEKQQKLLSTDAYAALLACMSSDSDLHDGISFVAHNSELLHQKQCILSPFAQILLSVSSCGIFFTPFSSHTGDSQVLYWSSHLQGRLAMGRIINIFVHR
jgi:hypothetical protein